MNKYIYTFEAAGDRQHKQNVPLICSSVAPGETCTINTFMQRHVCIGHNWKKHSAETATSRHLTNLRCKEQNFPASQSVDSTLISSKQIPTIFFGSSHLVRRLTLVG